MFRAIRTAVAGILAMVIAALPVMLDRCAESCDARRDTIASAPECHHATSTGTHLSQVPGRCGHDHNGAAVSAANGTPLTGRTFDSIVPLDGHLTMAPPVAATSHVRPHSPPDASPTLDGRSLPLRV
jgi:hypothetical protein